MILDRQNGGVSMDNIVILDLVSYIDSKMFQNCQSVFVIDHFYFYQPRLIPEKNVILELQLLKMSINQNNQNTKCIVLCTAKVVFENKKPSRRVSVQNLFFSI